MIIDCHAHMIPWSLPESGDPRHPRFEPQQAGEWLLTAGAERYVAKTPVWFETDLRLEALESAGVDIEVVSPMPYLLDYSLRQSSALELSRSINERVAEMTAESAGRIQGLGAVPLQAPEVAAGELSSIATLGLRGVEVGSHINGVSIGDRRFLPFFQEVERLGLAVFVHAISPAIGDRLPDDDDNAFGFAHEAGLAVTSLVAGGTLAACPDLRVSVSHGGGGAPLMLGRAQYFATGRWTTHDDPTFDTEQPSPIELASRLFYDSLMYDTRAVEFLAARVGLGQILLGSDFPGVERPVPTTAPLEPAGSDVDLAVIAGSNALRYLAIEESGF